MNHKGDPCEQCGKPHDEVNAGPCPGRDLTKPLKERTHFGFVMEAVESSNVEAIGYCKATNTLAVKFHAGGFYVYADAAGDKMAAIYQELRQAKANGGSVGRSLQIITRNAKAFPILAKRSHEEYTGNHFTMD